jgi:hypothetical protein
MVSLVQCINSSQAQRNRKWNGGWEGEWEGDMETCGLMGRVSLLQDEKSSRDRLYNTVD